MLLTGARNVVGLSGAVSQLVSLATRRQILALTLPIALVLVGIALLGAAAGRLLAPARFAEVGMLALAAAAVASLAALVLNAWLVPVPQRIAARLDRQYALNEALSTAIGLAAADGPVRRALARQASGLADGLDGRKLVPLFGRAGRVALTFLIAAVLVAAAAFVMPEAQRAPASPPPAQERPAGIAAAELEALAQLLAEDAERQGSDYLAAVSDSVERLAKDLAAGRSAEAVAEDLEALLEHARTAYGSRVPDWLQAGGDDVPATLGAAADKRAADEQKRQASAELGDSPSIDMYDLARQRTEENAELAAANAPADLPAPDGAGGGDGEAPASGDFSASPMPSQQLQQVGSFSAGGAAQSGKGESNAAGGGSQPLLDDSGFLQSMPDPTQDMALTAADPQADGRIRLFVPTSAEASESTGIATAAADYARLAAEVVDRQIVDGDALPIVSRYFTPPVEGGRP